MPRTHRPTLVALIAVLALFVLGTSAQSFRESYCSPQNTGTNDVYSWDYQSNGNCTSHCTQEGTFAFAVIQYKDCFCSNYIPSDQQAIERCRIDCPGYPTEHCGSYDDGLFIYIKLTGQPSGTAGAGGTPVRPTSSAPARPSSARQSSATSAQPQTSVQVITESGAVITRTVIQTPPPDASSTSAPIRTDNGNGGSNVGAIAGGVVGGVVGLLAIVGVVFFVLWKRKKRQQETEDGSAANGGGSAGITRNTSTMSKAGLLGGATDSGVQYPPVITNFGSQYSRYGADNQSTSPMSHRRNSQPLIVDSRMNPETYIEHAHANASRESVGTIDDSRDYARKLGVRNPDP